MPQLRVGIQLSNLRLPFKKALLTAAKLDADAVEIDARFQLKPGEFTRTGIRQIRKRLDDHNLRVCAIGFPTRRGYDNPQDLDQRVQATKEAMQFAYDLGSSIVVNQIGRVPETEDSPAWRTLIEVLTDLGTHGQRVGACLAAETGSEDSADLARLIDALPPGSLLINFDPGNLIINGFSAHDGITALGRHVAHVHARDAVRDLAQGRGLETLLGRGSVDFPELIGVLEEHNYRGYFTIERQHATDPVTEIGQAVQYLRNL
ncbi:MAG: sugar phosphate isomerase/epimerase family protein [Pirellulaceae bacterium]|nr:sugar phosphate isomerase/epimerase family protein [Pirellulaceae bacterium]MDP6555027.1 sugar phosphate isomerase/epimerase family protein [Pirellulaceae bacterium]